MLDDPTEAMIAAGASTMEWPSCDDASACWRAMIDAALAE
jgi:hypothetical protein